MRTTINWRESINQNRLVFTSSLLTSKDKSSLGRILITAAFTLSLLFFIVDQWSDSNLSEMVVVVFIGVFFFFLFSQHYQHYLALTRVSGISLEENRKILHNILDELQWTIVKNDKKYLICSPATSFFSASRQVTILFDGSDILLNTLTFSHTGTIAIFSTRKNTLKTNAIISKFELLCENKRKHILRHRQS